MYRVSASNEYKINSGGEAYRGDTMNSWQTTLDEFIRIWGRDASRHNSGYINDRRLLLNTGRGPHHGKWRIPQDDPASDWVELLSDPDSYNQRNTRSVLYYRIFEGCVYRWKFYSHSSERGLQQEESEGQFCRRLLGFCASAVYRYYTRGDNREDWTELFQEASVCRWLSGYGDGQEGWNQFVERNFQQDFVNQEGSGYGQPKELWRGHFPAAASQRRRSSSEPSSPTPLHGFKHVVFELPLRSQKTLEGQNLRELVQEMAGNCSKEGQ